MISISIGDLFKFIALFILFGFAVTVGVYLILVLRKLLKLISRASTLIEENRECIGKTLTTLPDVLENINDVTGNIKEKVEKVDTVMGSLGGAITETAASVGEGTANLLSIVRIINSIVKTVMRVFSSKK